MKQGHPVGGRPACPSALRPAVCRPPSPTPPSLPPWPLQVTTYKHATRRVEMAADDDVQDDPGSFSHTDFIPTSPPAGSSSAGSSHDHTARAPLPRKQLMETWLLLEFCNRGCLSDAVEKGWLRQPAAGATPSRPSLQGDGSCESSFSGGLTSPLPDLAAILATAREVAAAMSYLHHKNILHGDLTGGNVLLTAAPAEARGFTAKVRALLVICAVGSSVRGSFSNKAHEWHTMLPVMPSHHTHLSQNSTEFKHTTAIWGVAV